MSDKIDRRDFINRTTLAAAGLAAATHLHGAETEEKTEPPAEQEDAQAAKPSEQDAKNPVATCQNPNPWRKVTFASHDTPVRMQFLIALRGPHLVRTPAYRALDMQQLDEWRDHEENDPPPPPRDNAVLFVQHIANSPVLVERGFAVSFNKNGSTKTDFRLGPVCDGLPRLIPGQSYSPAQLSNELACFHEGFTKLFSVNSERFWIHPPNDVDHPGLYQLYRHIRFGNFPKMSFDTNASGTYLVVKQ